MSMKRNMLSLMARTALMSGGLGMDMLSPDLRFPGRQGKRKYPLPAHELTSIPKGHKTDHIIIVREYAGFEFEYSYYITWATRKSRTKAIAKAEAMFDTAVYRDTKENLMQGGVIIIPLEIFKEKETL